MISAISHPTRHRILRLFVEDAGRSVSAEELAQVLEQPMAQVGYHLYTLAGYEVLRLSRVANRGGSERGHYRWSLELEPEWLRVVLDIWIESQAAAG
jgi:DNA-binding transcriptional ArsR family regulator